MVSKYCKNFTKIVLKYFLLMPIILTSAVPGGFFDTPYSVPEPKVEVFERGFRVGIPDDGVIRLFAFHGNINLPMNGLEAGMFSRDILKKRGEEWVFEDRQVKLKTGDVLYFWLFVIRENLGYRFDDGEFRVKEIVAYRPLIPNQEQDVPKLPIMPVISLTSERPTKPKETIDDPRCDLVFNLTETVVYLTNDLKMLRSTNKVLTALVEKNYDASRKLKFDGFLPPIDNPILLVQNIIREKLGVGVTVIDATRNPNKSVSFTVETLTDKLNLIAAAKEKLKDSKIMLIY